jgi:hypothetical protein
MPTLMPHVFCVVQQAGMVIMPNIVGGHTVPLQMTSPPSG